MSGIQIKGPQMLVVFRNSLQRANSRAIFGKDGDMP